MRNLFRETITHPALALGSTVLWGVLEFMALQGVRRNTWISNWRAKRAGTAGISRARH